MPQLKTCFERVAFTNVKTVLSSGNVVFSANQNAKELRKLAEQSMQREMHRSFPTYVCTVEKLRSILDDDFFSTVQLKPGVKRVVTFLLKKPSTRPSLPVHFEGVTIHKLEKDFVYTSYLPHPKGPVFMTLLEKTFGKDTTTRTWDTLAKLSAK